MVLALNNLQRLICHKTQQIKPNQTTFVMTYKLINVVDRLKFKAPVTIVYTTNLNTALFYLHFPVTEKVTKKESWKQVITLVVAKKFWNRSLFYMAKRTNEHSVWIETKTRSKGSVFIVNHISR